MADIRTALVTGATGAIGRAIAEDIAAAGQHEVVLACRDAAKGEKAAKEIRELTGAEVRVALVDVSSRASVQELAASWEGPLHVLVNNAAATPKRREETSQGIELQWATNVLGYYWMIEAFRPALARSAPARVVNVASYWAGGLDLADPEFKRRNYDNDAAYRQSKQADRMLACGFAEALSEEGIAVNACHPGDVRSKLSSNLGFGGSETPHEAAATPVLLATQDVGQENTGKYFQHQRERRDDFCSDSEGIQELMALCARY